MDIKSGKAAIPPLQSKSVRTSVCVHPNRTDPSSSSRPTSTPTSSYLLPPRRHRAPQWWTAIIGLRRGRRRRENEPFFVLPEFVGRRGAVRPTLWNNCPSARDDTIYEFRHLNNDPFSNQISKHFGFQLQKWITTLRFDDIHPVLFITDTSTFQLVLSFMICLIWTSPVHYLSFSISCLISHVPDISVSFNPFKLQYSSKKIYIITRNVELYM